MSFSGRSQEAAASPETVLPNDVAAAQALDLSTQGSSLRLWGLDIFPRASAGVRFDNNIYIQPANQQSDLIWNVSPALAVTAGDLALYLPASVSLSQLRSMLAYGLRDEENRPQRYLGVEYQPDFNLYTENSADNYINQTVLFSAGYRFSRLSLELDQDYRYATTKSSYAGELVTSSDYLTRLDSRYQLTEKSFLEANLRYENLSYAEESLSGFQEFRAEGWFNRQVSANITASAGGAIGYLAPQNYLDQSYEQLLVRAQFKASEKLSARAAAGVEWRQFDGNEPDAINPTFSVSGIYQPTLRTVFTLELHRRELPSPTSAQNYTYIGISGGVRQLLFSRLAVGLSVGYDNVAYDASALVRGPQRQDDLLYAGLDFSYEFNARWSASLYYTYAKDDSNTPAYDYGNSIVGLRINWRY